ncbi:hypothetical protein BJ508DRAFT_381912 [Ascobolus immersus RN42]|uniref:Uncharacterized protein n=1 Tax=Ascobolus immersus RN42 TaxID=1160509 RepID=A0A3N4HFR8_ASCIM|nr:hypothetical protein BJ508DRAFT_381912 [Ascobolus immersus RN42]
MSQELGHFFTHDNIPAFRLEICKLFLRFGGLDIPVEGIISEPPAFTPTTKFVHPGTTRNKTSKISSGINRYILLWHLLWNKGESTRTLCERSFPSTDLLSGKQPQSPADPEATFPLQEVDLQLTTFHPTTKLLDLTKAPEWAALTTQFGPPSHGLLPAMTRNINQRMLILEDYEILFGKLIAEGEDAELMEIWKSHALILGNPGIGKRFALSYFLYRCLLLGKAVLYRGDDKERSILFSADGVEWDLGKIEKAMNWMEDVDVEVWVLVDKVRPMGELSKANVRMFETTGPEVERLTRKWTRKRTPTPYCMDLWSWEEVVMLKYQYDFPLSTDSGTLQESAFITRLCQLFQLFGGEPHLLLSLAVTMPDDAFEKKVTEHITTVKEACKAAISDRVNFLLSDHNYTIFASRPYVYRIPSPIPPSGKRSVSLGEASDKLPRSGFIETLLLEEIFKLKRDESFALFDTIHRYTMGTGSARYMAKAVFRRIFLTLVESQTIGQLTSTYELLTLPTAPMRYDDAHRLHLDNLFSSPTCGTKCFNSLQHLSSLIVDKAENFNTAVLGTYFHPAPGVFTSISALFFYRIGKTVMPALLHHTTSNEHPSPISGNDLEGIFAILPAEMHTEGRGCYGVFAFVTTERCYAEFKEQKYTGAGSGMGVDVRVKRFPQMKVCVNLEALRKAWISSGSLEGKTEGGASKKRKRKIAAGKGSGNEVDVKGGEKLPVQRKKART